MVTEAVADNAAHVFGNEVPARLRHWARLEHTQQLIHALVRNGVRQIRHGRDWIHGGRSSGPHAHGHVTSLLRWGALGLSPEPSKARGQRVHPIAVLTSTTHSICRKEHDIFLINAVSFIRRCRGPGGKLGQAEQLGEATEV